MSQLSELARALGRHTDPAVKAEVLKKIRGEGMRVTDTAAKYSVNSKTIYGWLCDNVVNNPNST